MKIVFAYNCWAESAKLYHENIIEIGKSIGLDIVPFCLTPSAPRPRYSFSELDRRWKIKYWPLVKMYKELKKIVQEADVLWVYNGGNFHPSWLKSFPSNLLNIYGSFDDPESSYNLSAPVAPYFDACMVGNIASIPQYQGWGCHSVEWAPYLLDFIPSELERTDLSKAVRPVDLVFFGERESLWRKDRLDYLQKQFPGAKFYGRGWPNGFVGNDEKIEILKNAKIGINVHNSTGPINRRLFELPAYGVMQVCDNKCRLGQIFNLQDEVIGYDNITEAVDLIKYYLGDDRGREEIAWQGHQRFLKDYSPVQVWKRHAKIIKAWKLKKEKGELVPPLQYKDNKRSAIRRCYSLSKIIIKDVKNDLKNELRPKGFINNCTYYQTSVGRLKSVPYYENPEYGPSNLVDKEKNLQKGGFFEWPNMVALNWAVASMVGNDKIIIELGSGTGCFAYEAGADTNRTLLCLEADEGARNWAKKHRSRPNIVYDDLDIKTISTKYDLLVTIDVIEHIADYHDFLSQCSKISERAIITTPNRFRNNYNDIKPQYIQHVREWSAGEFYWILKNYWSKVELFSRPDPYVPLCVSIDINSKMLDLIAVCSY